MGGRSSKSNKNNNPPPSTSSSLSQQDQSILELKRQKDRLSKYRVKLEHVLTAEKEAAKKMLKEGKTEKAKLALRRKKYQEGQLDKIEGEIHNIDTLVGSIESAVISQQVVAALKKGNVALQKLNDELNVEDVERMMEETADAIEYQNKISELLGESLTAQDEEDVLKQLDTMEEELMGKKEKKNNSVAADITDDIKDLPEAQGNKTTVTAEAEEKETTTTKRNTQKQPVVIES